LRSTGDRLANQPRMRFFVEKTLAVIVDIGSTLFSQFTSGFEPELAASAT